jgi:hypothetical protein
VVDDLEAMMRPKARLSKGMVGSMRASAAAILKAGRKKPDGRGIYGLVGQKTDICE